MSVNYERVVINIRNVFINRSEFLKSRGKALQLDLGDFKARIAAIEQEIAINAAQQQAIEDDLVFLDKELKLAND